MRWRHWFGSQAASAPRSPERPRARRPGMVVCLLAAACLAAPGSAAADREERTLIIVLPDPALVDENGVVHMAMDEVERGLASHVRLGEGQAQWATVYDKEAVMAAYAPSAAASASPDTARRYRCPEGSSGDLVREDIGRLALALDDPLALDGARDTFEANLERFFCQTDPRPVTADELRQLLIFGALSYAIPAMRGDRDTELFWLAYAQGTDDRLGAGFPRAYLEDAGLWDAYTRTIQSQQGDISRIPVHVDARALGTHQLYLDGVLLTSQQRSGDPIALYPGVHYLQDRDARGQVRSDTFEVPAKGASAVHLRLGSESLGPDQLRSMGDRSFGWFIPRLEELDDILWFLLTEKQFPAPEWLDEGTRQLLEDEGLDRILVVAPRYSRTGDWETLAVGQLVAGGGIVDLPLRERGPSYRPLDELRDSFERATVVPGRLSLGVTTGVMDGQATGGVAVGLRLARGTQLFPEVGISFQTLPTAIDRFMVGSWAGLRGAPEGLVPGLTWSVGVGGLLNEVTLHGGEEGSDEGWSMSILPLAVASVGIEGPLSSSLFDATGLRRRHAPVARLEVGAGVAPREDGQPPLATLELRLGLRLWHREDAVEALP